MCTRMAFDKAIDLLSPLGSGEVWCNQTECDSWRKGLGRKANFLILKLQAALSVGKGLIFAVFTSFCSREAIDVFLGSRISIAPAPKVCTASLNLSTVRFDNLVTTQRRVSMSDVRGRASMFTSELREPETK